MKCEGAHCERIDAVRYRQNTEFVNEALNWVTLCPECAEENDRYWADLWSQYYSECM